MTRILVAFDGSEPALRAVRHVAELAKLLKSVDALLLYVERSIPMRDRLFNGRPSEVQRLEAPLREAGQELLAPAKDILTRAGIHATVHVEFGDPCQVIAEHAKLHHCDMVVMGTHGRGALGSLVLGSVATKVLHLAHVPVTLVR